jgi:nucleoside-diphosphate-sugar epimerase
VERPEITIGDLAERLVGIARELLNYRGKVIRGVSSDKNYLVDNPNRRCPDIRKAREGLDYEPCVKLEDGLRRMLIWYAAHQDAEEETR